MLGVYLWVIGHEGGDFLYYTFSYFLNAPQGVCLFSQADNTLFTKLVSFHFMLYGLML